MRRGVRAYRATEHATTGVSANKLMFGRELRGKFPEVKRQPKHPDDSVIHHSDKTAETENEAVRGKKKTHSCDENQSRGHGIVQTRTETKLMTRLQWWLLVSRQA